MYFIVSGKNCTFNSKKNSGIQVKNYNSFIAALLIVILCLFVLSSRANDSYTIKHFNTAKGLKSNRTVRVIRDNRGYYWFGTIKGIQRFDGYEFKEFTIESTTIEIPKDFEVHKLYITKDSILLIGTSIGLLEFDELNNVFHFISFPEENNHYRVTDICAIDDSTYFLNSHSPKGVFVYKQKKKIIEHAHSSNDSLMNSPKVRLVLKGQGSIYYFHISYDLYKYDLTLDKFEKCDLGEISSNSYFNYGMTDMNNVLWILSGSGLYYMEPGKAFKRVTNIDEFCPLNRQVGSGIIRASDTSLYVAFDWWGIIEVATISKKVIRVIRKTENDFDELSSNQIYSTYLSPDGSLWWCNDGAYMITKDKSECRFLKNGKLPETSNYSVLDILEDSKGSIWIGTDGGGLHSYSIQDNKTTPVAQLSERQFPKSKVITSLYEDKENGELWIGTYGDGVFRYNAGKDDLTHYISSQNDNGIKNDKIWDVTGDNLGNILISSLCTSVSLFNKKQNSWKHLTAENGILRDNCVTTFEKDDSGLIWFGYTEAGIDAFDQENLKMSNTVKKTKDRIFSICSDGDRLWLGCMNGLSVFSKSRNSFIEHPVRRIFENIRIYDIFKDSQKRFWIASESGLYYFHETDSLPSISFLDKYFEDNIAKCITETSDGYLLIGGINGLLSIPVNQACNRETADFKIHLTDFKIFNNSYSILNNEGFATIPDNLDFIELPYNKNYISLSFSIMDISLIEDISYEVMVPDFYSKWEKIENGKNKIDLPNLQPGTYRINIKAKLKGAEDAYKIRVFTIKITPPWWKTIWFRLFISMIVTMAIITVFRQIKNKNKILTKQVEAQTLNLKIANKKLEELYESEKESNMVIEMKNDELTKTIETKDKLLAVIGHDFRNPLNALSGISTLLKNNVALYPKEKISDFAEQIHSLSNSISEQMITLLDWAKGQMNTIHYKPVDINLESLINDVIQLSKVYANQKDISLTFKADYIHNAFVDARMVSTVFRNLLSNAIKFSFKGSSILIMIQENDETIEVSFADSGIGMDEDKSKNIFDSFNSDYISYGTDNEQGSGLGLQICKSFIDKNNGKISVKSEQGTGSLFTVALPKSDSIALKKNKSEVSQIQNSEINGKQTHLSILLIEDNKEILNLLENTFGSRYEIISACDGNAGFQLAQNMIPDIIISDINMPKMNGLEMCRKIRQNMITQHIPIILITAENTENAELQSYELGATDFLRKPFDLNILQKKVDAFLVNRDNYKRKIEAELANGTYNLPLSVEDEIINKILTIVKDNFTDSAFDINEIADTIGLSRTQLWRKMKSSLGKTPSELIRELRLNKAAEMLKSGKYRISEIAYHVGFSDQRYFSRAFLKEFGTSPSEYMTEKSVKK